MKNTVSRILLSRHTNIYTNYEHTTKATIHNRVWDPQNDRKTKKITTEDIFKNSYTLIMKDKKKEEKKKKEKQAYVTY